MYPQGDTRVEPCAKMPANGYFFDALSRQEPIDHNNLHLEDNLEEFTDIPEEDLEYFRREVDRAYATGMEPSHLKNSYGDCLTFWGGGVDTQHVLPFGTPKEVEEQVLRHCEIFSKNGGFVFNTVHNIQANVPVENIVAMLNAVRKFNGEEKI